MNSDMLKDYDSEPVTASSDPDEKHGNLPVFSAHCQYGATARRAKYSLSDLIPN
jgi:hypothetical protein